MKLFLSFSAIMLLGLCLNAQTIRVYDKTTLQTLPGIQIIAGNKTVAVTNAKGEADISSMGRTDSICFSHIGYETRCLSYQQVEQRKYRVGLAEKTFQIDEIVISASRWEEKEKEIPARVNKIKAREIAFQQPQTAADVLGASGYAYIQKSQLAGGSPMLRGFATNRVLLVVDGVRMNNAIFRSGNLQNVISLDASSLEEAEILFGPGSVMYGSDAIGGVMDFHTFKPVFSDSAGKFRISGDVLTRYSSASNEKTGHANLSYGWNKLAFVTSFTMSDYGDLRAGTHGESFYLRPDYQDRINDQDTIIKNSDPSLQVHSGYSQQNFMQKVAFRPFDQLTIDYSFHWSQTSDAPRYDRLILDANNDSVLDYAEWYYGPQKWMMNRLGVQYSNKTRISDHIRLTAALQNYEESRHDRKFNNSRIRHQTETVDALSVNVDVDKKAGDKTVLFYGGEWVGNAIGSVASRVNIVTGEELPTNTRYPDGSTWQTLGVFAGAKHRLNERLLLNTGIRYSWFRSEAMFDTSLFPFPFTQAINSSGALNGSLGAVYSPGKKTKTYLNLSSGFRAPNMDDIGKVFESEPGSVVVPNADLKPEYAWNAECGATHVFGSSVKADLSCYYTLLQDAIVRRPYSYNGADSILYDGELSRVQAMQNIAKAYVYGVQAGINVCLGYGFDVTGQISYQKGKEQSEDSLIYYPKNHVAPLFGSIHLVYRRSNLMADAYMLFNGRLDYEDLPLTDRNDHYVFLKDEQGLPYVPAWQTLNAKVTWFFYPGFSLSSGVENITDRIYRTYASGITAPGRNLILALRATF